MDGHRHLVTELHEVWLLRQVRSTHEGRGASLLFQVLFYGVSDPLWTCLGSKPRVRNLFGEHVFCLSRAGHADPQQKRARVGKTDSGRHFSGWSWVGVPWASSQVEAQGADAPGLAPRASVSSCGARGLATHPLTGPGQWMHKKKEGQVPKDTCFQTPTSHPIS